MPETSDMPAKKPWEGFRRKAAPESGSPEAALEQPFPGYRVTEKIAQGGMGAVFRALDERLDRDVAIKALIPDLQANHDAVESFFNEARNVARLRHPNVVRGLDVGRAGQYFFFVMEYVRGESLAAKLDRLERHRIPERESLHIVRQIAEGLQYIFENGLVHRDIKPGNILLMEGGTVKICDLGIAREVAFPSAEAVLKGSPSYASPEQARGDCDVDIRSDLYGLGCLWYHMLLEAPPFKGATPEEILRAHLETPPPSAREADPRLSSATSQLILWLLEKDRDRRPRTPRDFLNKLQTHPVVRDEEEKKRVAAEHQAAAEAAAAAASEDEEDPGA